MKILLLIDSLGSGGAQRQLVGLAKLLRESRLQVKLIYYHKIEFYKSYLEDNHVDSEYIAGAGGIFNRIIKIRKAIKEYQPDVVISYLDTPNIVACVCKIFGSKFRLIVSERNTTQKISKKDCLKYFLMRWADAIVPNSYSQTDFINSKFRGLRNKVHTITNFTDTDLFEPIAEKEEHERCVISCVGRVAPQKNVKAFLEVVKRLKAESLNFVVNWYGYVDPRYAEECKMLIKEYDIADSFIFHEPTKDVVKVYQSSDIFCLPSIYEGYPNVVCEAMCCGLPIACSDVNDNAIIVEDGVNGYLFNPHDLDDMTTKLRNIISLSTEQRKAMGVCSRELAIDKFSAIIFIKKYLNLIES